MNRFATISGYIADLHETPRLRGSHQHHPPHHSHWQENLEIYMGSKQGDFVHFRRSKPFLLPISG